MTPVIAPAFYWDFGPASPVTSLPAAMICANLDRLELYVAGEHFATLTPDAAAYPHLAYPPSFADFTAVDGSSLPDLRIDGYLGDELVASRSFSADPSGDVLTLAADDAEIAADGTDATRLSFRVVDRYGAPRPYVTGQVTLDLDGPGVLIGDNPFDFAAAGGVGAAWLRSLPGSAGPVTVTATHPTLGTATASIRVIPLRPNSRSTRSAREPISRARARARWSAAMPGRADPVTRLQVKVLPPMLTVALSIGTDLVRTEATVCCSGVCSSARTTLYGYRPGVTTHRSACRAADRSRDTRQRTPGRGTPGPEPGLSCDLAAAASRAVSQVARPAASEVVCYRQVTPGVGHPG